MFDRCIEINNAYSKYVEADSYDLEFPYERYLEEEDKALRMWKILGPNSEEDVQFVTNAYELSMKKKKIKKKDYQEDEEQQEGEETVRKKEKTNTYTTVQRKEWCSFLKVWVKESNLFHHQFPKSQHASFYKLRINRLANFIYIYLHRYSYYLQVLVDLYESDPSEIEEKRLYDGRFVPVEQMIDPASTERKYNARVYFPLDGKLFNKFINYFQLLLLLLL